MNLSKFAKPWLPLDRIEELIGLEPYLMVVGLGLVAFAVYKIFLRTAPPHRHRNLRGLFLKFFLRACGVGLGLALYQLGLQHDDVPWIERLLPYFGLIIIGFTIDLFVRIFRIYVFEYLFLKHMREGVPLLLVNLSSLLLSVCLYGWLVTEVLAIKVLPLLATSAVFTAILGLALQDTLGNLFAGVALQFDKPFELGDWIEVNSGGQKWVGQVDEVTWRATILISFTDELLLIPNKVISQAQISNYSSRRVPIIRSQVFHIPFGVDLSSVRAALLEGAAGIEGLRRDPAPSVLLLENADSWIQAKLIYYLDNFGQQYPLGDRVLEGCHRALAARGIDLGKHRVEISRGQLAAKREGASRSPA